ncbi:MerR family transcriptional regulator [Corynebacterium sp. LaCa116]|uniref:MerR family transcriptional regulator n=1 Tax=Corynebacterium sp. LaCa116 TaxID=3391423 RepID=UPI00398A1214
MYGDQHDQEVLETFESRPGYVQESLFDIGPDEELGYRVPIACQVAGITYRQLDYWARTDLVKPSIRTARGSGSQRLYSFKDVLVLKIVKRLLDTGISLQNIRLAVDSLRDRGVNDLAELTLVSDGATVYECRSNDEVIDLLAGGQGVFGIAVPGILKELSGTITSFPAERIVKEAGDEDVVVGLDELAARRKRKSS